MNIPCFRFSIAWSRILPKGEGEPNKEGIDFYNKVINCCLENGIEPWVTLYHWDLPHALEKKGGWANREILTWFENYVNVCAEAFGDRVKKWLVFNEPNAFVTLGYLTGIHAPGRMSVKAFLKAVHHVVLCHGIGGRILKNKVSNSFVGSSFYCAAVDAWEDNPKNEQSRVRAEVLFNKIFIEPILGMGYPEKDLPLLRKIRKHMLPGDEALMKFDFDFVGLQHYTRFETKRNRLIPFVKGVWVSPKKSGKEVTALGWEVYAEGMYRVIKKFAAYENMPRIYITENGAAFDDKEENGEIYDPKRIAYLHDYLEQILKAKQEGIDVGGYFVWSFIDNFELAEGFGAKFGLVAFDPVSQKRTIKESGKWFGRLLKEN